MQKKTAETLLKNYVTPAELKFKYLPGEKILVDSFYIGVGQNIKYIAFMTNKRIILRMADWVDIATIGCVDMRFINWSDVEAITFEGISTDFKKSIKKLTTKEAFLGPANFFLSGKVIDFSPEKESVNYFYGLMGNAELLSNLAYPNSKEWKEAIFPVLNQMSKDYDFPLLILGEEEGYSKYSNDKNNNAIKAKEKVISISYQENKLTVYGVGVLLLVVLFLVLFKTIGATITILLFAVLGYFAYKKFKNN